MSSTVMRALLTLKRENRQGRYLNIWAKLRRETALNFDLIKLAAMIKITLLLWLGQFRL